MSSSKSATTTDNGEGMDETTQSHIFEPFFTTKEPGKRTGLGLATVYGIVSQSGGYIWVNSESGQGTTFKVYLPQVDEKIEESKGSQNPERPRRMSETVLLVEDEDMVRELPHRILLNGGYMVFYKNHVHQMFY